MKHIFTITQYCYISKLFVLCLLLSGKVRGDTGIALAGVTVTVKGTSRATTTDANGNYAIIASPGDRLVFSFVGYAKQ